MPLDKSLVQVPFAGGLDQRTDAKNVVPGKLLNLINGVFDKNGAIRKRKGTNAYTNIILNPLAGEPTSLQTARSMFSLQDELCYIDGDRLYSYSPESGQWVRKDQVPEPVVSRSPIGIVQPGPGFGSNVLDILSCDSVVNTNNGVSYAAFAWVDNATASGAPPSTGDLKFSMVDLVSGVNVYNSFKVVSGVTSARMVVVGNFIFVVYKSGANIAAMRFDTLTMNRLGPTNIFTDANIPPGNAFNDVFDIAPLSATQWYLVYEKNAGVNRISVNIISTAMGIVSSNVLTETATNNNPIGIKATQGETLWVAYAQGGGSTMAAAGVNPATLAQTIAPTAVFTVSSVAIRRIAVERISSTTCVIVATSANGNASGTGTFHRQFNTSASAIGPTRNTYWFIADSRPFAYNGRIYLVGLASSLTNTASTLFTQPSTTRMLVDLSVNDTTSANRPARVVARFGCRISGGRSSFDTDCSVLSSVHPTSNPGIFIHGGSYISSIGRYRIDKAVIDFTQSNFMSAQANKDVILSGGVPSYYDGSTYFESGFHAPVPFLSNSFTAAAGGSLGAGIYGYALIPSYIDRQGQVHRGQPVLGTIVTGASNKVTISLPTIGLTERMDAENLFLPPLYLDVYRTAVGGSTYQSIANVTINDPTIPTITIVDTASDASISSYPIAYTTGAAGQAMPNVAPPSSNCVIYHNQRIWLIGDDRRTLWFSKQMVSGEPANFADANTMTVEEGGDFTALGSMDSKLFAFKKNLIFVITGDGPDDTGANSDFSVPQKIATDVGCIEPRSVVLTPLGLMFQSAKGMYLIDRALNVSYIGKDVEDLVIQYNTITSAILLQDEQQVRFTCSNGTNGIVLMYDYLQNAWGQFQYYDIVSAKASAIPQAACINQGIYAWTTDNGNPYKEVSSTYLDGPGQWVTLEIDTAWIKMAGVTGFQRVYRGLVVGDRYTSHDITVDYYSNYDESGPTSTATFKSAVTDLPSVYEWEIAPSVQKTEAVRLRIRDATPSSAGAIVGTGRGFSLAGLSFEVGVKRGAFKLPQLQRG